MRRPANVLRNGRDGVADEGFQPQPQVQIDHYRSRDYNSKERVCSFWHQFDETARFDPESVLEVGPGAGIVTRCLRGAGFAVTTLDLDPTLEPDVCASVTELPFEDRSFDIAVCCEVLEHLPYDEAERALHEVRRVVRSGAVVSLPDVRPWFGVSYPVYWGYYVNQVRTRVPAGIARKAMAILRGELRLREVMFVMLVPSDWAVGGKTWEPRRNPIPHGPVRLSPGDEHHYEIGMDEYPLERILMSFERAGFAVEREFRVPENPWHHFFRLLAR